MSFLIILGIALWIMFAFWPASIAKNKGYSFFLFLIASWFISFFITLIIVLLLKDKNKTPEMLADEAAVDKILDEETRQ